VKACGRSLPAAGRRRALGALALGTTAAAAAMAPPTRAAGHGPETPAWPRIVLLDGSTIEPGDWRGQAIVLVVWATYCPYCRRHNPRIEALHRASAGRPLRVLGAALDHDPALVMRHARERGYTFPITLDAEPLRERFGLRRVIPTTVIFDRRGRLLQRIPGEMAEGDVLALAKLADTPT
jgi:thiol-disulfide isomerase/thioredoxin